MNHVRWFLWFQLLEQKVTSFHGSQNQPLVRQRINLQGFCLTSSPVFVTLWERSYNDTLAKIQTPTCSCLKHERQILLCLNGTNDIAAHCETDEFIANFMFKIVFLSGSLGSLRRITIPISDPPSIHVSVIEMISNFEINKSSLSLVNGKCLLS